MENFLRKLKLVTDFTIELDIKKDAFTQALSRHIEEGSTNLFFNLFEVFSSGAKEYKGHVDAGYFKMRKKRKFFDMGTNLALAEGNYNQRGDSLIVETKITAFNVLMLPFAVIAIPIYGIAINSILLSGPFDMSFVVIPFITIHAAFMFGIPYFILRRSVKRLHYDLKREFYYATKEY